MTNLQSRYHKERSARLEWQNQRRADNRLLFWQWLTQNPCVDCGEADILVLELDHLIPKEKRKNAVSLLVATNRNWDYILKEIEKCVVRCANCHRKKTAADLNYGKVEWQRTHQRSSNQSLKRLTLKMRKTSKSFVYRAYGARRVRTVDLLNAIQALSKRIWRLVRHLLSKT